MVSRKTRATTYEVPYAGVLTAREKQAYISAWSGLSEMSPVHTIPWVSLILWVYISYHVTDEYLKRYSSDPDDTGYVFISPLFESSCRERRLTQKRSETYPGRGQCSWDTQMPSPSEESVKRWGCLELGKRQ